ncbi:hypothetical protein PVAG01_08974 [Phlyctema vagabunda]|uniref:Acyltransferase 3 domain-containing protein n=1 Tax=Phlyctema vagabunda TaxID=108571 RepID=A0ABR4PAX7_9HELO
MSSRSPSPLNLQTRKWISRLCITLLPSFVQPYVTRHPNKVAQLHPTSWLDGIRGFASVAVFICHFVMPFHDRQDWGYGAIEPEGPDDKNRWKAQLPIFRLVYSGGAMVNLIFVISGFALSYKPIKLLRDRDWDRLFQTMSSASFRRLIRISYPMVMGTFMAFVLIRLGVYEWFRKYNPGIPFRHPTIWPQFWSWLSQTGHQMDFLGPTLDLEHRVWNEYGPQTWTVPLELRCSFILFILIIALCRTKVYVRFSILVAISCHCVRRGYWEVLCFLLGMMLSELEHIRQESASKRLPNKELIEEQKTPASADLKWICAFVFSLFLLSSPNRYPDLTPGYGLLDSINPLPNEHPRFWPIMGSCLLIWSVANCLRLQSLFTTRFAQYLGQVSYSLYLTHGILNDTVEFMVIEKVWAITGKDTVYRYELGWSIMFVVMLPLVFWVADLFWRGVDLKSITLSRWVEKKLCFV